MEKLQRRRALSPVLAVVILLGITVVAGGIVFSVFSQASSTAMESSAIFVQDASIVTAKDHASFSMTIQNAGSKAWSSVAINGFKGEIPAVIFYRPASWIVSSDPIFLPDDPVVPSRLVDLDPSSTNSLSVIGIGNLISWTENPNSFGASTKTLWPDLSTFCTESYSKIGWADVDGDCNNGFQTYVGKKLDNPIEPGDTFSPASFVLTRQLTNSTGSPLPHDFVQRGETIIISVIVSATDGSTAQKDVQVRVA